VDDLYKVLPLLMPLVWLCGSLLAAMILYWTSKAFLDAEEMFGIPIKRLRLGGSVVIFLLVFFVLWKSTTFDTIAVRPADMEQIREAAVALQNTLPMLEACQATASTGGEACKAAAAVYGQKVEDLDKALKVLPLAEPDS
jgi:hypothetical protein